MDEFLLGNSCDKLLCYIASFLSQNFN